jgi:hypothetical protein
VTSPTDNQTDNLTGDQTGDGTRLRVANAKIPPETVPPTGWVATPVTPPTDDQSRDKGTTNPPPNNTTPQLDHKSDPPNPPVTDPRTDGLPPGPPTDGTRLREASAKIPPETVPPTEWVATPPTPPIAGDLYHDNGTVPLSPAFTKRTMLLPATHVVTAVEPVVHEVTVVVDEPQPKHPGPVSDTGTS